MASSQATGSGVRSFFERVMERLDPKLIPRFEALFNNFEICDEHRRRFRVGRIIREAWSQEFEVIDEIVDHAAKVFEHIAREDNLDPFGTPSCCFYHKGLKKHFSVAAHYPKDHERLGMAIQAIWALFPSTRGSIAMRSPRRRNVKTSRFMMLDSFLERHVKAIVYDRGRIDGERPIFFDNYSPFREQELRQADLRALVKAGDLIGFIGGYPEHAKPIPKYCEQRRPFSTPTNNISAQERHAASPEAALKRLGLQFDSKKTFVELIYHVPLVPSGHGTNGQCASIPTVIDAEGYWLFRPDRVTVATTGLRWNYTRDVGTNGRGYNEVICSSLSVGHLVDLIVWPKETTCGWAMHASPDLISDSYI